MRVNVSISTGAFLQWALILWLLPVRWWMSALLAAAVHELSHLMAIRMTGGQVLDIRIDLMGARICTLPMKAWKEVLCAAAGPAGSFFLAGFPVFFPETAFCAAVQCLYNLLPVYPLDGGRILQALLPEPVCSALSAFSIILLLGLGLWACIHCDLGFLPLIPAVAACCGIFQIKYPCKDGKTAVQ